MSSDKSNDVLVWLQSWIKSHIDGDWEHQYGVHITTLDNPGWAVDIDLADTELDSSTFPTLDEEQGENDWIMCRTLNKKFEGRGDTTKLLRILTTFKDWASSRVDIT